MNEHLNIWKNSKNYSVLSPQSIIYVSIITKTFKFSNLSNLAYEYFLQIKMPQEHNWESVT